jgi:hypothetical protein
MKHFFFLWLVSFVRKYYNNFSITVRYRIWFLVMVFFPWIRSNDKTFWVEHVWNVMAHAQKPDLVFRGNGRVHLNRRGRQFSWLLAAEVCASAVVMVVMLDTPHSEVEWKTTGYPLHSPVFPSLPLPCVTVCHQVSTALYHMKPVTPSRKCCIMLNILLVVYSTVILMCFCLGKVHFVTCSHSFCWT